MWQELVDLWVSLNRRIIRVVAEMPEEKRDMDCSIGVEAPIPLSELIARYSKHCGEITTAILS